LGNVAVKIVVIVLIVALLGVGGYFGQKLVREKFLKHAEVGSIDRDEILKMAAFTKAQNSIERKIAQLNEEYTKKSQGMSQEQLAELSQLYQQEIETIKTNELKPLLDKAQAAVALVAAEKKMKVVLDKKIVVCGAQDITEEVKDMFRSAEKLEAPTGDIGADSQIGYFDQEVVRSLKIFRDVDSQFFQWYSKLREEAEDKVKAASTEEERQKIFNEYNQKYKMKQDQMYAPVLNKVTKTVENVAKEKSLTLVLDKQYVMYGGRNLTEDVAEKLK
jgi:outer membrane protein